MRYSNSKQGKGGPCWDCYRDRTQQRQPTVATAYTVATGESLSCSAAELEAALKKVVDGHADSLTEISLPTKEPFVQQFGDKTTVKEFNTLPEKVKHALIAYTKGIACKALEFLRGQDGGHSWLLGTPTVLFSPGHHGPQIYHVDLLPDKWQFVAALVDNMASTLVWKTNPNLTITAEEASRRLVGEESLAARIPYPELALSRAELEQNLEPAGSGWLRVGDMLAIRGGRVHAGPAVESGRFRAGVLFTAWSFARLESSGHDIQEQHNPVNLVKSLLDSRPLSAKQREMLTRCLVIRLLEYHEHEAGITGWPMRGANLERARGIWREMLSDCLY